MRYTVDMSKLWRKLVAWLEKVFAKPSPSSSTFTKTGRQMSKMDPSKSS